jgi:hypothetical protein
MIHWLMEKMGLQHCPECATLVDFAMDGLEDGQRSKVRQHLTECPPCMEQVRDFLQVNEGLGLNTPQAECPEGFEQRVLQRLKQEGQAAPSRAQPPTFGAWAMFWLRLGPVFAVLSLVMTFVAFAALWHSGASAGPSSELSQATEALMKDPGAMHVALAGSLGNVISKGELVLCRGKKLIYFNADNLGACRKGANYVLWMQTQDSAQTRRLAAFVAEADGKHFELLQLPQALDAKGSVKFMVTQDDMGSKPAHSAAWLAGTATL